MMIAVVILGQSTFASHQGISIDIDVPSSTGLRR